MLCEHVFHVINTGCKIVYRSAAQEQTGITAAPPFLHFDCCVKAVRSIPNPELPDCCNQLSADQCYAKLEICEIPGCAKFPAALL